MQDGSTGLDELRARLTGLSKILGTAAFEDDQGSFSHCSRPICNSHTTRDVALSHSDSPGKPCTARSRGKSREGQQLTSPPFRSHIASSKSVLRSTNQGQNNSMGFTYAGFKEQEAKWLSQKGELQMMHNKEKKKRLHVESELKRVQEMHQYRVGEVKHLKTAVEQRDVRITELQDRIRELEVCNTVDSLSQQAVQQAEAERNELRDAMQEIVGKLSQANEIIAHTEETISTMETKVQAARSEQQHAVEQAHALETELMATQEIVKQLEWKCGMLQQLADMTLQQNEEKMNTLRELLKSESLLDAGITSSHLEGSDAASNFPDPEEGNCSEIM